jgi:hypothetical protein
MLVPIDAREKAAIIGVEAAAREDSTAFTPETHATIHDNIMAKLWRECPL